MKSWLLSDWARALAVLGLAAGMTGTVWIKVQMSESARGIEAARSQVQALRVEGSRLQAAVDLACRPSLVRDRAQRELGMTVADPTATADLFVRTNLD